MMKWNKYCCGWIALVVVIAACMLTGCGDGDKPKVVVCVPVYGQSLAMGEESELVTDIDGLTEDLWAKDLTMSLGITRTEVGKRR